MARTQQRVLALAQLAALVIGTRQVHQDLRVVVEKELLQAVLILKQDIRVMSLNIHNIYTGNMGRNKKIVSKIRVFFKIKSTNLYVTDIKT